MDVGALTRYDERIDDNRVTWPFVALSDIQRYNNESIHEKLHELAGRMKKLP
jgi:hypothetical protein